MKIMSKIARKISLERKERKRQITDNPVENDIKEQHGDDSKETLEKDWGAPFQ